MSRAGSHPYVQYDVTSLWAFLETDGGRCSVQNLAALALRCFPMAQTTKRTSDLTWRSRCCSNTQRPKLAPVSQWHGQIRTTIEVPRTRERGGTVGEIVGTLCVNEWQMVATVRLSKTPKALNSRH